MVLRHEDVIAHACARMVDRLDLAGSPQAANPQLLVCELLDRMREAQDRDAAACEAEFACCETSFPIAGSLRGLVG
jgi:hypothetical protein